MAFGNSTAAVTASGVPAGNRSIQPTSAGANETAGDIACPSSLGTLINAVWRPTVTASTVAFAASTITAGWISCPLGDTSKLRSVAGIASGTWTFTVTAVLSVAWSGSFQLALRAWQVSSTLGTATKITLPGADANGIVYSATTTPGVATSVTMTITLSSVGAVTFAGSTPYLFIEAGLNEITKGALASNVHPSTMQLVTPAVAYSEAPTESNSTSDSASRQFVGTRATADTLTTADSVTRAQHSRRSPTESLVTADAASRVQRSFRSPAEALTTADSVTRRFVGSRSASETLATADTVSKQLNLQRRTYDDLVPADWHSVVLDKTISGVTRDSSGVAVGGATVKLFRQADDFLCATTTSSAVAGHVGEYSFTRDRFDPNQYYVIAYKADVPELHGVTDRGLLPV